MIRYKPASRGKPQAVLEWAEAMLPPYNYYGGRRMGNVMVRFYEELNDYLPPDKNKKEFEAPFQPGWRMADLLGSLGAPQGEVDLILINGAPADLSSPIKEGSRISVYPKFERLDVSSLSPIIHSPLRRPRFFADLHLGKLARYLRALGFDSVVGDGNRFAAENDERILLTRNEKLKGRKGVNRALWVNSGSPPDQLAEVVFRLDLYRLAKPFSICVRCNSPSVRSSPEVVLGRVPPKVLECHREFFRCRLCGKIYWQGASHRRMSLILAKALEYPAGK